MTEREWMLLMALALLVVFVVALWYGNWGMR